MIETIKINDNIFIKKEKKYVKEQLFLEKERTIITLIKDNQEQILSDKETNDYFSIEIIYDNNNIVVYSKGYMINQIPLNIEAVYNINRDIIFDLTDNRTKEFFKYLYINKITLKLEEILTIINKEDLKILEETTKEEIKSLLTYGNTNITEEELIEYILNEYPILKDYQNLKAPLTAHEYIKIKNKIGHDIFRLYLIMPPELKNRKKEDKENKEKAETFKKKNLTLGKLK